VYEAEACRSERKIPVLSGTFLLESGMDVGPQKPPARRATKPDGTDVQDRGSPSGKPFANAPM